jgi:hypothetical protein
LRTNITNVKNKIMKQIRYVVQLVFLIIFIGSCTKTTCDYTDCKATCKNFEDFESYGIGTFGNWQQVNLSAIGVQNRLGSKRLRLDDASGGSYAFNTTDFPRNLVTAGCELSYDVEYSAGTSNGTTANSSIGIYQGSFPTLTFTRRAFFQLKVPNLIVDGAAPRNIKVPLALATGTSLPSNAYGDWILVGGASVPTPSDIADFNALIQNIAGLYLPVDNGANPAEIWWYDNFCFTQCCP